MRASPRVLVLFSVANLVFWFSFSATAQQSEPPARAVTAAAANVGHPPQMFCNPEGTSCYKSRFSNSTTIAFSFDRHFGAVE
jgi:hypothetical protein